MPSPCHDRRRASRHKHTHTHMHRHRILRATRATHILSHRNTLYNTTRASTINTLAFARPTPRITAQSLTQRRAHSRHRRATVAYAPQSSIETRRREARIIASTIDRRNDLISNRIFSTAIASSVLIPLATHAGVRGRRPGWGGVDA